MEIRKYRHDDLEEIIALFKETVLCVNRKDYAQNQVEAWANRAEPTRWSVSLQKHLTYVAVENGMITGFGDMDENGYLDRLFVHKDFQGMGIATAICDRLERETECGSFLVNASITARPFFERRGYNVIKSQEVEIDGVLLTNYVMKKRR